MKPYIPTTEAEFQEFAEKYKADERKRHAKQFAFRKLWAKSKIEELEQLNNMLPTYQQIMNQTFEEYLEEINS